MMIAEPGTLSLEYIERLYEDYLANPASVPSDWQDYFVQLPDNVRLAGKAGLAGAVAGRRRVLRSVQGDGAESRQPTDAAQRQERLDLLIRNYRVRGHLIAKVNPLHRAGAAEGGGEEVAEQSTSLPSRPPELEPAFYGFTADDLDRPFSTRNLQGADAQTLRAVVRRLEEAYCGYISVQFMHIDDLVVRQWIQQRMEDSEHRLKLTRQEQLRILTRLTDAVIFEEFVRRKYVGAKTFSLEGAESLIPLLDLALEKAGAQGIGSIVMGMAHRGRLNVLANIIGKSPQEIFREFEDRDPELFRGSGDVKYHLGYQNEFLTSAGRKLRLTLCFNPSHLEFVDPVAIGMTRAMQDRGADFDRRFSMALLIHGDAAFAGEGIVQEMLNLSQLPGYTVGGTLHVIVNNQIGFTTPPEECRSTHYATDVARMLQIPIFHVNGEHPEAVARVVGLAMEFRQAFQRDVVIDMYCYRRLGHNEGDEPAFTQPLLYRTIEQRMPVREAYLEHLLLLGEITAAEAEQVGRQRQEHLEHALSLARREDFVLRPRVLGEQWRHYHGGPERPEDDVDTGVARDELQRLLERLADLPADFHVHRKLARWVEARREAARGERPLDWTMAEALALASLAAQGYRVRLSGQDAARGTFSQRHAVLFDVENGRRYVPLQHVAEDQPAVEIVNSPLCETGVLGFEYGYSLGYPDALVLWEAQFGDFVNVAQVIVDQFLSSAEDKWRQLDGVVLLLPHGFEGQGPEHSSARIERFLQLAAEHNVQIVVPSTPAQYFHCLRRQAVRRWKKPLIVFTPKSLLRHPRNVSALEACATGRFQRVIPDFPELAAEEVQRILLCSGKIYYELLEAREKHHRTDVALVRIEQLYPLSLEQLAAALAPYRDGTPAWWVQEEPLNMGAAECIRQTLGTKLLGRFPVATIARPASASPASGSAAAYRLEQQEILARALGQSPEPAEPVVARGTETG